MQQNEGKKWQVGTPIKGGGDNVMNSIWMLRNMAFKSNIVPEYWRSAVIVPLYKGKEERTECKNYGAIKLLRVVGKLCVSLFVKNLYSDWRFD